MLKRLVPHFYPKMHLDDYWRPFSEMRLDYLWHIVIIIIIIIIAMTMFMVLSS